MIREGASIFLNAAAALTIGAPARAADPAPPPPEIHIERARGPITVDGDLSDEGWKGAVPILTWFETNPGDNIPPAVKNVGYVTFDDRYFYVGLEMEDPDVAKMRAPVVDRDGFGGDTDYAGVMLDTRNDGKTALELLVNPRGVQLDGVLDDVSGNESVSPDFFWTAVTRITPKGWVLEMRVPFSSLRY